MALVQLVTSFLLMHNGLNLDPVTSIKVWRQVSINLTLGVRGVETGGSLEFISWPVSCNGELQVQWETLSQN